jgi:hypothetical protein
MTEQYKYSSNGKKIHYKNSNGFWSKCEYDSKGNLIYIKNSMGLLIDNRSKTEATQSL